MSHSHVQQLEAIGGDFEVAQAAVNYIEDNWNELLNTGQEWRFRIDQVRRAAAEIESTYVIRLFAEFESVLRDYLAILRPGRRLERTPMQSIMDSVALRAHVPDEIRDRAHEVRRYRNFLVHSGGGNVLIHEFRQAKSSLNRFVAVLADL